MGYLRNLLASLDFASIGALLLRVTAVLLCLTVHELSHGWMAWRLGDPTAKREHRLSLNPLHHIDWFGLLAMLTVGFGWAKPVPVDPRYFKKPKQGMAWTALAGPLSNGVLTVLLLLLLRGTLLMENAVLLSYFLYQTALLSLGLGLFNLLPIPPLDGSKVLFALLPERYYVRLLRWENVGMLLLIALTVFDVGGNRLGSAIWTLYSLLLDWIVF